MKPNGGELPCAFLTAALAAGLLAAPVACAGARGRAGGSVKIAIEKGMLIDIMGMLHVDMAFNAKDGSVAAMQGQQSRQVPGGRQEALHLIRRHAGRRQRMDIPDGKKSGDVFNVSFGQLGEAQAKIQ